MVIYSLEYMVLILQYSSHIAHVQLKGGENLREKLLSLDEKTWTSEYILNLDDRRM
jgi:hypothetical protein